MSRIAAVLAELTVELIDPRGRCDRRGLLAIALVMMAPQVVGVAALYGGGADPQGTPATIVNAAFIYMAASGTAKRLHDTGRSAWWMLAGLTAVVLWCFALTIAALLALGSEALQPDGVWCAAIVAASSVPALGMLLWLHVAQGDTSPNRFGPVPYGLGFARQSRRAQLRGDLGRHQSEPAAPSMAVAV